MEFSKVKRLLTAALVAFSLLNSVFPIPSIKANPDPEIVYVDDDYNSSTPGWGIDHFDKIQNGIDVVNENGAVYVFNGSYYENVTFNKSISLIGEDKDDTIIKQHEEFNIPEEKNIRIKNCTYAVFDHHAFIYGDLVLNNSNFLKNDSGNFSVWRDICVFGQFKSNNSYISFSAISVFSDSNLILINTTVDLFVRASWFLNSPTTVSNASFYIERSYVRYLLVEGANNYTIINSTIDTLSKTIGVKNSGSLFYWNNTILNQSYGIVIPDLNITEDTFVNDEYWCIYSEGSSEIKDSKIGNSIAYGRDSSVILEKINNSACSIMAYAGKTYVYNSSIFQLRAEDSSQILAINTTAFFRVVANGRSNVTLVSSNSSNYYLWDNRSTILIIENKNNSIVKGNITTKLFVDNQSNVQKIEYYIDDTLVNTTYSSNESFFSWKWDTTKWKDGEYQLSALTLFNDNTSNKNTAYLNVDNNKTKTIYVDDDADPSWYDATHVKTIQEGIDNASTGDTVYVYNGTYYENVIVNKSLTIQGSEHPFSILNANKIGNGFYVTADNVSISGFTIVNATSSSWASGICLNETSYCNILENNISNSLIGVFVYKSNCNVITNNNVCHNSYGICSVSSANNFITKNLVYNNTGIEGNQSAPSSSGIMLFLTNNTDVKDNSLSDNLFGMLIANLSLNNTIENNTIINNDFFGIYQLFSSCNNIIENNVTNNTYNGICLSYHSDNNILSDNIIKSNRQTGIEIGESSNNTVFGNNVSDNSWGVSLHNSNHNYILNNTLQKNNKDIKGDGINLGFSTGNILQNNTISESKDAGIQIMNYSSNNIVRYNVITLNEWSGISLWNHSSNNTIINNSIDSNDDYGIRIEEFSNNNIISENIITDTSGNGIWIEELSNINNIYHNDFINNIQNAHDECTNTWDNDYPSGGNYWDDYTGTDSNGDGIGDTPYNVPGGSNQDRYPLIAPFGGNHPPTVSISSPTNGQTVSGTVSITGTASDLDGDSQIEKVQVRIDSGSWNDAIGTTSWSYSWNTNGVLDGGHTVYARAYDGSDYSPIDSVSVTVDNEEDEIGVVTQLDSGTTKWLEEVSWEPTDSCAVMVGQDGTVLKYDGNVITQIPSSNPHDFQAVDWKKDGSYALMVGIEGLTYKFDGDNIYGMSLFDPDMDFHGVNWPDSKDYALLVGRESGILPNAGPFVAKYINDGSDIVTYYQDFIDGSNWDIEWNENNNYALACGSNGGCFKFYDDGSVEEISPPVDDHLWDIAWKPNGDYAFIVGEVGDNGLFLKFDGNSFTYFDSNITNQIYEGAWKPDGSEALFVGRNGIIIRFDGDSYSVVDSSTTKNLYGVGWRNDGQSALIVGSEGTVLKYSYESGIPSVSISSPSDGQTISGTISIKGTASDPDGSYQLEKVQVRIDSGSWIDVSGTTSWSYSWNTNSVSDGGHTIYARAYDGSDYSSIDSVSVTVDNDEDGGGLGPPPPPPPPEEPILSVSSTSHDFGYMDIGDSDSWNFNIQNTGVGTLEWETSESFDWASLSPSSGSITSEIVSVIIYIDTSDLEPNDYYHGSISIISNGGDETVEIELHTNEEEATVPGRVTGLTATPGDEEVSLNWDEPDDGGSPIIKYKIYSGSNEGILNYLDETTSNSYTDIGLVNDETYCYKVSAVNSEGEGPKSNEECATPEHSKKKVYVYYPTNTDDRHVGNYISKHLPNTWDIVSDENDASVIVTVGGPSVNSITEALNDGITRPNQGWGWNGQRIVIPGNNQDGREFYSGLVGTVSESKTDDIDLPTGFEGKKIIIVFGKELSGTIAAARTFLDRPSDYIDDSRVVTYCENKWVQDYFDEHGSSSSDIEFLLGFNIRDVDNDFLEDAEEDTDGDGIWDRGETNLYVWDTENDCMDDKWESIYELNPLINDANIDSDSDDLVNIKEYELDSKPNHQDLFIEIDYMFTDTPSENSLDYFEDYYGDLDIDLHFIIDEEVDYRQFLPQIEDLQYYEENFHDFRDTHVYVLYAHRRSTEWPSLGVSHSSFGAIVLKDQCREVANELNIPLDNVEKNSIIHEVGHCLHIVVLDENNEEWYCEECDNPGFGHDWCIMAHASSYNCVEKPKYCDAHWSLYNLLDKYSVG